MGCFESLRVASPDVSNRQLPSYVWMSEDYNPGEPQPLHPGRQGASRFTCNDSETTELGGLGDQALPARVVTGIDHLIGELGGAYSDNFSGYALSEEERAPPIGCNCSHDLLTTGVGGNDTTGT